MRTAKNYLIGVVLILTVLGCAPTPDAPNDGVDQAHAAPTFPPTAENAAALPPDDLDSLNAIYGPALAARGLTLTTAYLAPPDDYYHPTGKDQLALYATATRPLTPDEYIDNVLWAANTLTTDIFQRWPELDSYDLCQLPPIVATSEDNVTRVEIDRVAADHLSTTDLTFAELIAASNDAGSGISIVVLEPATQAEAYLEATS